MPTNEKEKKLVGYRSRLCVRPGDRIDFMVHSHDQEAYEADLVRIIHGELSPKGGPGLILEELPAPFAGTYEGVAQDLRIGSFLRANLNQQEPVDALTFAVAIFPTLYLERDQTVADFTDPSGASMACLRIGGRGRLELEVGNQRRTLDLPIPLHRWSFVGFSLDQSRAMLFQVPQSAGSTDSAASHACTESWNPGPLPTLQCQTLSFASRFEEPARPRETWNGRMDSPRLIGAALSPEAAESWVREVTPPDGETSVLGFWDFSVDVDGREVRDLGPAAAHAEIHQLPNRAVRGFRWTGKERDYRHAPLEYAAIHFHDDDVYDMGWPTDFSFTVPENLRSGAYAARLRLRPDGDGARDEDIEYLTFFVSPSLSPTRKRPAIALVLPTATYLAYANEVIYFTGPQLIYDITRDFFPEALFHHQHEAFGRSQYESHSDGSGIHFSSWLRPLWNVRPNSRAWCFPADTNLIHWLETQGFDYDVITDHDLHEHGAKALEGYSVLMTGTHPEYLTTEIYDAYEGFLGQGGRLMYMGGNGFYWRIAMSENWPATTELRRAEDGTRAWVSEPGEYHHAFDGELGGLWRRQARPPNRLVGTGFSAQGFYKGQPYHRTPESKDPRAEFIFQEVDADIIGAFGRRCKGVVGEEIDRFDVALGSPSHALVLASTDDFESDMFLTKEDLLMHVPQRTGQGIRADLVFFETPSGGAVFSVSSISWSSGLDHENFDNDVSQITENVLRRFIDPAPFEMPSPEEPEIPSRPTERIEGARITG